jgi:predicted PurR-regulated permease PerM
MKIYEQKASGRTEEVEEGFNILAFLFGPFWYLFKGMVLKAILIFIGVLILSNLLGWFGAILGWIIMGLTANKTYEDHLIKKSYSVKKRKKKKHNKSKKNVKKEK